MLEIENCLVEKVSAVVCGDVRDVLNSALPRTLLQGLEPVGVAHTTTIHEAVAAADVRVVEVRREETTTSASLRREEAMAGC